MAVFKEGRDSRDELEEIVGQSTLNIGGERFQQLRQQVGNVVREVGAYSVSVPKLLYRLASAPDVPTSSKLQVLAAIGYLAMPADLIPDFIPGVGWLDDFVVAAGAIAHAVNRIGKETVLKHWDGPRESFERICDLAGTTYGLVQELRPYVGKIGKRFYYASRLLMR